MTPMRRCAAFTASAVAAAALVSAPAHAGAAPPSEGVDPYFPTAGSMAFDVGNYALDIRYDPRSRSFAGVATISATTNAGL